MRRVALECHNGRYLESLAADHGVEFDTVLTLVDVLGPEEDFDRLVTSLEDFAVGGF